MSYGGVEIDLFFHSISILKMEAAIQGLNCAATTNTGNTAPIANAGSNFTVPKLTPFLLEGMANDPDSSNLKYTWEQVDPEEGLFSLLSVAPQ